MPRAAHPQYESKRIESEVIAAKSLKKGVLTGRQGGTRMTPAVPRQRAQLGLAFTRRAARVLFHGSHIFAFYSPTRIFGSHG